MINKKCEKLLKEFLNKLLTERRDANYKLSYSNYTMNGITDDAYEIISDLLRRMK